MIRFVGLVKISNHHYHYQALLFFSVV